MNCRRLVLLALVAIFSGCPKQVTIPVPDYDILVARDGSGDHRSVQEAVEAARPGEVIYVKAGTYPGAVEIETDRITLLGAGPGRAVIDAGDEYAALTLEGGSCAVSGFTIENASSHGVYVKSGDNRISRCLVVGNGDRGIYFSSFGGDPSAEVDHCTITDNEVSGIYIPAGNDETAITNCVVAFNSRGIVSDVEFEGMRVDHNCVHADGDGFDRVARGRGNIEQDPRFVNRAGGDYRLQKDSPCIGSAGDGTDIGCF
ncbi:MAG: pectinesterase family protein [bacterium]